MKNLKKINIGLILTIITVLAVVIYSINIENQRKNSKEEVKKCCEEYIDLVNKYSVLPENVQILGEDAKKINVGDFYKEMEEKLKDITISDSAALIQKKILSNFVEKDLLDTSIFTINYDRKITKINSYEFDGNQVTVAFECKATIKQKYIEVNLETGEQYERMKEHSIDMPNNSITLENKDEKWKVVYSDLDYGIVDNARR
ncbi:MAG: hypothetical protein IJH12_00155 [Clostridia bacterium]|nr:hypothetical protein [Clostridia bacterium]